jgi:shikimate kinase/3-dehydroquinate synthase
MGSGKSTVGRLLAELLGVPFADADEEIERAAGRAIPDIFETDGEGAFREVEAAAIARLLEGDAGVLALGGGALRGATATLVRERSTVIWLDVTADVAWERVRPESARRPLARDETAFRALHAERRPGYAAACDVQVDAAPSAAVVAASIMVAPRCRPGAIATVADVIGNRRAAVIVDDAVATLAPASAADSIVVPGGERAKSIRQLDALWRGLAVAELERRDVVVAIGGGAVTDVAGFAAATFRRGVAWIAVPTTLVGQVDAAIGGKTAIDVAAKNDVGAFHLPEAVIADPVVLETLPPREWAAGFAEVVKTALLAGGRLWEIVRGWQPGAGEVEARTELVRLTAAYKARVVGEDPTEQGLRAVLNLGHTIGHGVEAAAGYGELLHGEAVAIGLLAALRLSVELRGLDAAILAETEQILTRAGLPTRATGLTAADVAAAMRGDKKRAGGRPRLVLLDSVGSPVFGIDPGDDPLMRAVSSAL